jgi:acetoin utilization deacetylase AcuC-like enzyme
MARVLPFKLLYDDAFNVDFGPHIFPSRKYHRVRERLLAEGLAEPGDFVRPDPATDEDVRRVHTAAYVRKAKAGDFTVAEARTLEVPWSPALVRATWACAGACIAAGPLALRDGCAVVLAGGLHHAFPDHGEGFCLVNDVAVAVRAWRARGEAARVSVLDLDVHQGNGTAAILGGEADSFTVSIHQEANYPMPKPPGHVDLGLPDGISDEAYLDALAGPLYQALTFRPDLLAYLAGADPYEGDRLGGLALTLEGLEERDRRVFHAARAARVPVVVTLGGGYAERPDDTVRIHVNTVRAAALVFGAERGTRS